MSYVKLIAGVVVLGALVWLGLIVNDWREKAALVPVLEDRIDQANAQIEAERELKRQANAASEGYQDELNDLRADRAAAPARTVRLCHQPAVPAAAGARPGEPGPDGPDAGAGKLPQGDGLHPGQGGGADIGRDLRALADRADDIVAQCRGLQDLERRRAAPGS